MIENNTIIIALGLSLFAGLSTGIGSAIAFFTKRTNTKALSLSLGFSAGVMIFVSFVEIFPEAKHMLTNQFGEFNGYLITLLAFFGGILLSAIIDRLIPCFENPHEMHTFEKPRLQCGRNKLHKHKCKKMMRVGIFTAVALAIHNFPEGLITFTAALNNINLGITLAIAVAIHNIPEGISVSIPIFYATGSRKKAFFYSFISGLTEPLGALVGYLILLPYLTDAVFGIMFGAVAGIMIYISLDELLPSAREYGEHHLPVYGLIAGMFVMAISLLII